MTPQRMNEKRYPTPPCTCGSSLKGELKCLPTILIVIFILMLLGAMPSWPHSKNWGYYPSSGLGLLLLIVIILTFSGRL
jgi:hypothetical protein